MKFNIVKCSDIIDVRDGTHDSPKYIEFGYPLVTSKNIKNNKINFENINYISKEDFDKINKRSEVENGDILMPMIGTIGNPVLVNEDVKFAIKNVALFKLAKNEAINNKYFYYLLESDYIKRQLESKKRGGTQSFVSLTNIRELKIPVPEKKIQDKIATLLSKSKEIIYKREEQIKVLDKLIDSTFNELIQNDRNQKNVKLNSIVDKISTGKSYSGEEDSEYKVLKTSAISYKVFDENEVKNLPQGYIPEKEHLVKEGDLLVSRMNTSELVGAAAYVNKSIDKVALPDRIWRLELNSNINPIYLWYCLNTFKFRNNVSKIASGTSGSMKNIAQGRYLDLDVTYVDITLQNKFAEIVNKIEKEKELLKQSLGQLETNFKALEQKAFNGELFN